MENFYKHMIIFCLFFCLGFGIFYNAMRFNVPWYGNNDFEEYSKMVEKPFNNTAISPFVYRVITPTVAHFVHESGLYFKSKSATPFEDKFTERNGKAYSASILHAMMFTNFLFIILACTILSTMIGKTLANFNENIVNILKVFVPILLLLSLSTVRDGIAAINEGGGLLTICVLLYLFRARNLALFILATFVSIFQREIASIIFLVYIISIGNFKQDKLYALTCLTAFITYLVVKIAIYPVAGWDHQTDIHALINNLLGVNKDFFKHLLFGNNVLYASILFGFLTCKNMKNFKVLLPYFYTMAFIILLSAAEGIGNSVDRTMNLILPIFLITLIELFQINNQDNRHIVLKGI